MVAPYIYKIKFSDVFFCVENLSIVVVVTLATASIALLGLLTSAGKKSISQLNMLKLTFNSTVLKKNKTWSKTVYALCQVIIAVKVQDVVRSFPFIHVFWS